MAQRVNIKHVME